MIRSAIRSTLDYLDRLAASVFGRAGLTARAFYGLLNSRFAREQAAVLRGRSLFGAAALGESDPQLRRNTHRLEKGLLMRPRAPTFATDYIAETVAAFERACLSPRHDPAEWAWAHDVLSEYFRVVRPTDLISTAEQRFRAAVSLTRSTERPLRGSDRIPRARAETMLSLSSIRAVSRTLPPTSLRPVV